MTNNNDTIEQIWQEYLRLNDLNETVEMPEHFYFCDNEKDANECAELVVQHIKQATATSLWWYETNNEPLPNIGDQYIITDWAGNARAIIETTKVEQVPYKEVTAEFAQIEGEGDKSLAYWRRVHEAYYRREMEPQGAEFHEDMVIVCEYFKTIHVMG